MARAFDNSSLFNNQITNKLRMEWVVSMSERSRGGGDLPERLINCYQRKTHIVCGPKIV